MKKGKNNKDNRVLINKDQIRSEKVMQIKMSGRGGHGDRKGIFRSRRGRSGWRKFNGS